MAELIEYLSDNSHWAILGLGAFILLITILKSMIKVSFPNAILVVTGRKKSRNGKTFGFSVERGRTMRIPYLQTVSSLDLGVIPINVRVEGVNSANGITLGADATACVCIDDDNEALLYSAVERLMGKDVKQIQDQIRQTLIGNFRGALNKATPLQAIGMEDSWNEELAEMGSEADDQGERAQFRNELLNDINSDLSSFGMQVVSVSLQKIWDTSNYIGNLAQKTLAQKRQQVEIEEARLRAVAEKAESDGHRRIQIAKTEANEKILAARQKLEVYQKESEGTISQASLEADNGIKEAINIGQRDIQEQMVELQKLRNQSKTLTADADKQAVEIIASGQEESVNIREGMKNNILQQKVEMLTQAGLSGLAVLFIQQQLPELFEAFKLHAKGQKVDSLVIMDSEKGFNGAVNRGPAAFVDFLKQFEDALGINIQDFIAPKKNNGGQA